MQTEKTQEEKIADAWVGRTKFSVAEAAALWVGESPPVEWVDWVEVEDNPDEKEASPETPFTQGFDDVNTYKRMLERITEAIYANELISYLPEYYDIDDEGNKTTPIEDVYPHGSIVTRKNLMKWAETQGSYPAFLFSRSVRAAHWNRVLALCLDESHEYHSKELAIAIKTWEHLYMNGNINKGESPGGHKEQFINHINENFRYSEDGRLELITENMVNHIATVAHNDPRKHKKPKKLQNK